MTGQNAPEARAIRLGVNVDHVATLRNARGGPYPDPVRAAWLAAEAGADGITAHLREDRRHIRDDDIARLRAEIDLPLNFEMAATAEMQAIALRTRPHAACIVPERREERTTEGGLDAAGQHDSLQGLVSDFSAADIRVSLFIAPEERQIEAAIRLGSPVVELHTGPYCEAILEGDEEVERVELTRLADAARLAVAEGLEVHAGHGLTFDSATTVAGLPGIRELNIGHFLIAEAVYMGLGNAIARMRGAIARGLERPYPQ